MQHTDTYNKVVFDCRKIPREEISSTPDASTVPLSSDDSDRPKRPLSAYNYFFQHEREQLLSKLPVRASGKPRNSHGKLGFSEMARAIGAKWRSVDEDHKAHFRRKADADKARYKSEMVEYKKRKSQEFLRGVSAPALPSTLSPLPEMPSVDSFEVNIKDAAAKLQGKYCLFPEQPHLVVLDKRIPDLATRMSAQDIDLLISLLL